MAATDAVTHAALPGVAVVLDPISVTGAAVVPFLATVGFYDRQREDLGVFLDREAIEQQAGASEIGHLLRRIPGIRVNAAGVVRLRGIAAGAGLCMAPQVRVDGVPIETTEMKAKGSGFLTPNSWTRAIHPIHIEAIEVYRSPVGLPAEYIPGVKRRVVSS